MEKDADLDLKIALFVSLTAELSKFDFVLEEKNDKFVRTRGDITDIFQLVFLDGKPGYRVQPNVGVRLEKVEEIFHLASGFDGRNQKNTATMGSSVGNLRTGDARCCEVIFRSIADLIDVTEEVLETFHEFCLPYFEHWGSISAIDAEINDKPLERTRHRSLAFFRCSTGIIVAKLIGRSDYKKLSDTYLEVIAADNKGFYLKRFQALLSSLEAIEPGCDLLGKHSAF